MSSHPVVETKALGKRYGSPAAQRGSLDPPGSGKAKLARVTPHVLRRTTGTALSEARVPEAAAAAIMGHSLEVFHGTYLKATVTPSSAIGHARRSSSSGLP